MDRDRFVAGVTNGHLFINYELRAKVTPNLSGKTYSVHFTRSGICAGSRYQSEQAALDFVGHVFFSRWLRGQDTEDL